MSQLLMLFTTPVVYIYLDRVNHWLSHLRRKPQTLEEKIALPNPSTGSSA